ncbi:hypothetical protein HaLaN_04263 [Haematococcus lacustris]|uniref:Uncharacterized protein n=1 Tax=Haematococcus lacustris TaxID=44745 RepID=A0A699YQI5_HAELA|nr:hypothetical protein HaLaN_04263 [Haematococcus lacustris]
MRTRWAGKQAWGVDLCYNRAHCSTSDRALPLNFIHSGSSHNYTAYKRAAITAASLPNLLRLPGRLQEEPAWQAGPGFGTAHSRGVSRGFSGVGVCVRPRREVARHCHHLAILVFQYLQLWHGIWYNAACAFEHVGCTHSIATVLLASAGCADGRCTNNFHVHHSVKVSRGDPTCLWRPQPSQSTSRNEQVKGHRQAKAGPSDNPRYQGPTQPTKGTGQGQGKTAKAKPAPQPGR